MARVRPYTPVRCTWRRFVNFCAAPRSQVPGAGLQQALQAKVQQTIATNQLQAFYPPQALQQVMAQLSGVDFRCGRPPPLPKTTEP